MGLTELCKFLRNISTNICGLGECTNLKLGEVSSLFIFNRITISWLYPLNGFRFIFLLRDSQNDLLVPFVTSPLSDGTHFDNPPPLCVYSLSSVHLSDPLFFFFKIQKVGTMYRRKMMTGYITHATGLRLGVNSIGRAVKRVNLQQHCEWQISITCHLNPVPHFVEYFGHKLHLSPQASFEQLPIIFIIFRNETVNWCSHVSNCRSYHVVEIYRCQTWPSTPGYLCLNMLLTSLCVFACFSTSSLM